MAASVFDSPLFSRLFPTGDAGRLFSDSAAIRAMLLVEGALAKVQGASGVIPEMSAAAIHRASLEIQIDPGALASSTGQNGVSVPGLVAAFRDEMQAPEHAQFVHWGATSQDIIDSALMLRLRQALTLAEADLRAVIEVLGRAAFQHAETAMPARTYGQIAVPTTWGAVLAGFGAPLCDALTELPDLRRDSLWVSLSGAAGTGSMLGPDAGGIRTDLAKALGLGDPGRSWHTDRTPILRITDWMGRVTTGLGAMADTVAALTESGTQELLLGDTGASSTMPQKQNPVAASAVMALASQASALRAGMPQAAQHRHQRDGAAWFAEWMLLPQIVLCTCAALQIAKTLAAQITPDAARMRDALDANLGMIHAEALSFALTAQMARPDAQAATKALCAAARDARRPLPLVAMEAYPDLPADTFTPQAQLGSAPREARAFAARVEKL